MGTVTLGVDIGQRADPTALVVVEEEDRADITHYIVRMIERMPLGTPYPVVANRVVTVVRNLELRSRSYVPSKRDFRVKCIVDATGVGLPVIDLIREQGVYATAALFTSGEKLADRPRNVISIGKGFMVGRLQVLLQAGRLHLPISPEAKILVDELRDYEIKVNEHANASFNAPSGKHDDLVCALGLAVGEGKGGATEYSGTWLPDPYDDDDDEDWERGCVS